MVSHNALLCFALSATSLSCVSASSSSKADDMTEDTKEAIKEVAGVLKSDVLEMKAPALKKDPALSAVSEAVLDAEKRQVDHPEDAKEAKEEQEALAVAEATTKVLQSQAKAGFGTTLKVDWEKLQEEARQAFLKKKEQGESTEKATAKAYQVEMDEIGKKLQALQEKGMPWKVKNMAKEAGEAAGEAIKDTDNPVDAEFEAMTKIEDEEKHEHNNTMAYVLLIPLCAALIYVTARGYWFDRDSPYVQRLKQIRKEEDNHQQPIEFDSMYNIGGYSEMR